MSVMNEHDDMREGVLPAIFAGSHVSFVRTSTVANGTQDLPRVRYRLILAWVEAERGKQEEVQSTVLSEYFGMLYISYIGIPAPTSTQPDSSTTLSATRQTC